MVAWLKMYIYPVHFVSFVVAENDNWPGAIENNMPLLVLRLVCVHFDCWVLILHIRIYTLDWHIQNKYGI